MAYIEDIRVWLSVAFQYSQFYKIIFILVLFVVYLRWVPRSREGPKGLSLTTVLPVPVAERQTVCKWLSWMDISSLSLKGSVSFRWATTFSSSWHLGGTSPSLGSTRQKDFLQLWRNKNTNWSWWAKVFQCDAYPMKEGSSSSLFHDGNVIHLNISVEGALSSNSATQSFRFNPWRALSDICAYPISV